MSRYCLDTGAYGRFMRGDNAVIELLDGAEWIGIPSIVLGELWTVFTWAGFDDKREAELRELMAHPVVEEVAIDAQIARLYGEIQDALHQTGTLLPANDVWIAAAAAERAATVVTEDDRFSLIGRVGTMVLTRRGEAERAAPRLGATGTNAVS